MAWSPFLSRLVLLTAVSCHPFLRCCQVEAKLLVGVGNMILDFALPFRPLNTEFHVKPRHGRPPEGAAFLEPLRDVGVSLLFLFGFEP